MIYKLFYMMMLVGYLGLSLQTPDIKGKLIGILLLIVNALIFWR
jgi:hypothetical protein